MFLRTERRGKKVYYSLVEDYRDERGKVKQVRLRMFKSIPPVSFLVRCQEIYEGVKAQLALSSGMVGGRGTYVNTLRSRIRSLDG